MSHSRMVDVKVNIVGMTNQRALKNRSPRENASYSDQW